MTFMSSRSSQSMRVRGWFGQATWRSQMPCGVKSCRATWNLFWRSVEALARDLDSIRLYEHGAVRGAIKDSLHECADGEEPCGRRGDLTARAPRGQRVVVSGWVTSLARHRLARPGRSGSSGRPRAGCCKPLSCMLARVKMVQSRCRLLQSVGNVRDSVVPSSFPHAAHRSDR